MGSIKADLNSALSGHRALFNSNIANSLDDLVASATGIKLSNVPKEIQSHAAQMKATASAAEKKAERKADGKETPPKKAEQLQFPSDAMKGLVKNWISLKTIEDPNLDDPVNIWLPMPKYTDDVSIGYSTKEVGLANEEINRILEGDWSSLGGSLAKGLDEGWTQAKEGMTSGLQALAHGAVINPVKFQLFEGVSFRTHSYTWDLHPFNAKDSANIEKIIYLLKMASLPKVEPGDLRTYKLPAAFMIDFHNPDGADMSTYEEPLLSCLTKVAVDYSGGHDMGFIKIDEEKDDDYVAGASTPEGESLNRQLDSEQQKGKVTVASKIYPNGVQLSLEFTEISTLDRVRYKNQVSYTAYQKNLIKTGTLAGGGTLTMAGQVLDVDLEHIGEDNPNVSKVATDDMGPPRPDQNTTVEQAFPHGMVSTRGEDGEWVISEGTADRPIEMHPAPMTWNQMSWKQRIGKIGLQMQGYHQNSSGEWFSPQGQSVGRLDDFGDDG